MANPFATRATEFVRTTEGFLSIVAPDPVLHFFGPTAVEDRLYRQLIVVYGTPGSGKTTIAKLFEFSSLATLTRASDNDNLADLINTLNRCRAFESARIRVAACRLPLESDYQEIWQLPYDETIRTSLLFLLIQARAAISWFTQFQRCGISPAEVGIVPREGAEELLGLLGGADGAAILEKARAVEREIYRILGALIPPNTDDIEKRFRVPYRLFDCLYRFQLKPSAQSKTSAEEAIIPLVILDDAHCLHSSQLHAVKKWLMRRELKFARWIMSRLDVLQPSELFASNPSNTDLMLDGLGATKERDFVVINLQNANRSDTRRDFRVLAKKMGVKYLRQMEAFRHNEITDLSDILQTQVEPLSESNRQTLSQQVQATARKFRLGQTRINEYRKLVDDYCGPSATITEDVRLAMLKVVFHRYSKRVPQQELLFSEEAPDPGRPISVEVPIYDAACIHLMYEFGRPYYFGIEMLCDSASENAEMFLRISDALVTAAEVKLLKQRGLSLTAKEQHRLLLERASKIVTDWSFPEARSFKVLAEWIAKRCLERTLEPNAPLGAGANAYGIPVEEFETLSTQHPKLAQVIKYALAYNALCLVPKVSAKAKTWCLFELGGPLILHYRLPLKRGGFVEGNVNELADLV